MSDRKRAVFSACASRTVKGEPDAGDQQGHRRKRDGGLADVPEAGREQDDHADQRPEAGSANPALRSRPRVLDRCGRERPRPRWPAASARPARRHRWRCSRACSSGCEEVEAVADRVGGQGDAGDGEERPELLGQDARPPTASASSRTSPTGYTMFVAVGQRTATGGLQDLGQEKAAESDGDRRGRRSGRRARSRPASPGCPAGSADAKADEAEREEEDVEPVGDRRDRRASPRRATRWSGRRRRGPTRGRRPR